MSDTTIQSATIKVDFQVLSVLEAKREMREFGAHIESNPQLGAYVSPSRCEAYIGNAKSIKLYAPDIQPLVYSRPSIVDQLAAV